MPDASRKDSVYDIVVFAIQYSLIKGV